MAVAVSGVPARVRLELESTPESVALVRSVLGAFADAVALGDERLDDIATATSEACNNVVVHAYDCGSGPLTVAFAVTAAGLEVHVSDRGGGLRRRARPRNGSLGVGLAVITALADSAEFVSTESAGTEVRMTWRQSSRSSSSGASATVSRSASPVSPSSR